MIFTKFNLYNSLAVFLQVPLDIHPNSDLKESKVSILHSLIDNNMQKILTDLNEMLESDKLIRWHEKLMMVPKLNQWPLIQENGSSIICLEIKINLSKC